ncbi:MFS transporter [Aeromicrobium chenweiae]|uniref:MFS transporter n=1 Tax=Aeromicrobium chenweiae TaxID=2079793 RepID=A0A2S0WLN7_9ACTN|nr:MFS transporter [Aeromicrobium chenweiae]AWB92227.1 MFS transporter [Aeromicrobium chenweiae]TGN31488.1 MFS transporter [Aeromicrobium chenweiae]
MTVTLDAPPRRTSLRTYGFALAISAVIAMMIGASAPSPFYPVLQQDLGFSASTMTAIFAVYAVALLIALLVAGSLSDHIGRRPVISLGFVVLAASMVAFWHADTVTVLFIARVVQGVAAGLLMSSLSAAVVDLEPASRPGSAATLNSVSPLGGLAAGALVAGLLLDHTSSALAVVFGGLTTVYVIIAAAVWLMPETSPRTEGLAQSFVPRMGIPQAARAPFLRSAPALLAGWATGGLYLSLGAALVSQELGGSTHLEQGLVVAVLTGVGSLTCFVARNHTSRQVTIFGTTALATGTALTLGALATGSYWSFVAAAVVAGSGFGASFFGIMRSITPTAAPHERGELFASVFVISYLAFGIPAVIAGTAAPHIGLAATTYAYGGAVVVLSATAALLRTFAAKD